MHFTIISNNMAAGPRTVLRKKCTELLLRPNLGIRRCARQRWKEWIIIGQRNGKKHVGEL